MKTIASAAQLLGVVSAVAVWVVFVPIVDLLLPAGDESGRE